MQTLDKRNEHYGLDCKISPSMLSRHEVVTQAVDAPAVSVQELVNLVCDLLDGDRDHDIADRVSAEMAPRVIEIRDQIKDLWTYPDGRLVI